MVSYADGHIATILNGFTSRPADCERPLALGWTPLREHINQRGTFSADPVRACG